MIRKHGVFYIIVTRNVSEKPEYSHKGILGIDPGVNNIAVDNDREVFDSKGIVYKQSVSSLKLIVCTNDIP